jgi:hypothetical protein
MKRSQWVGVALVVAVLGAGCGSAHGRVISDPPSSAPSSPRLVVVLNDRGLRLSATHIRAGRYLISFQDVRSHLPAGDRVALEFGASGPRHALVSVPAGGERVATLLQNDIVWVTVNGKPNYSPGGDSVVVAPTREFPTPVT